MEQTYHNCREDSLGLAVDSLVDIHRPFHILDSLVHSWHIVRFGLDFAFHPTQTLNRLLGC